MKRLIAFAFLCSVMVAAFATAQTPPAVPFPPPAAPTPTPLVFSPVAVQSAQVNVPFCLGMPSGHVAVQVSINGSLVGTTTGDFCILFTAAGTYKVRVETVNYPITVTAS